MEIKKIKIQDVKPYLNNNKTHPIEQVEKIAKSIEEFGFRQPIIVDMQNVVIAGHGRLLAAKKLGLQEVPVIVAEGLTDAQIKAYRIMDNKSAESEFDFEALKIEFDDLDVSGVDLSITGFSLEEIGNIRGTLNEDSVVDIDFDDPENVETNIERGDVIQIGKHILICGDSTDESIYNDVIKDTVHLVFTSPPYNMASNLYQGYNDNHSSPEYLKLNDAVINNCMKVLKGFLFWNISYNKNSRTEFIRVANNMLSVPGLKFMELVVWNKKTAMPILSKKIMTRVYEDIFVAGTENEVEELFDMYFLGSTDEKRYYNKRNKKALRNYWEISSSHSQQDNHKACFPAKLPARAISICCDDNSVVLDPFGGAGTTMLCCEQMGLKSYAIELLPNYCQTIVNRMRKLNPQIEVKCLNKEKTIK